MGMCFDQEYTSVFVGGYSNKVEINKTIIRGIKKVTRLNGIVYYPGSYRPKLDFIENFINGDIIQELNFDLAVDCRSLSIVYCEELCEATIRSITIHENIKTIVVDKITGEQNQEFNYNEIMDKYDDEFDEYYQKNVTEKYKNDKPKMIEINNWINGGMTKEDVLDELEKPNVGVGMQQGFIGGFTLSPKSLSYSSIHDRYDRISPF